MTLKFRNTGFRLFALLLLACSPGFSSTAQANSRTITLDSLTARPDPAVIRNAEGFYSLSFPVSDREKPLGAMLDLHLINSNALKANRSQLVVYLNGMVLGQIRLDPANNATMARFKIDDAFLRAGYNNLSFKVAQHYTDNECENWGAPELWTQLDLTRSSLTLEYEALPVRENLADLDRLINDRVGEFSLTLIRGHNQVSDDYLYWGSVIAQGIKSRLNYVPMHLAEYYQPPLDSKTADHFGIDPKQLNGDAIIVGTQSEIRHLLPEPVAAAVTGPYLGLFRQELSPDRFILVIAGRDASEVSRAVKAFALIGALAVDSRETVIRDLAYPLSPALAKPSVMFGHAYPLSALGFKTARLALDAPRAEWLFDLPADFYSTDDTTVGFNLDIAYSAAMRSDSSIQIRLNDVLVSSVQLRDESGAHYQNYRIDVPLRSFKPGQNRLTFDAVLTPLYAGECLLPQRNHLAAYLSDRSIVSFPEVAKVVSLPDLALQQATGFPWVDNATAQQSAFHLLDPSSDSIVALWSFIAELAAHRQTQILDLTIDQGSYQAGKHDVFIGKLTPSDAQQKLAGAPVVVDGWYQIASPHRQTHTPTLTGFFEWLERILFSPDALPQASTIRDDNALILQTANWGKHFVMTSYFKPDSEDKLALAILTSPGNDLTKGLEVLDRQLGALVAGDTVIWDSEGRLQATRYRDPKVIGHDNAKMTWIMHFSRHPWHWLAFIVVVLGLSSWLIHRVLSAYQKRHHA
ncbi:MAG: cellulose biosynthesis cyclic di-GMP-binding regulatory protein BcsB [Methylomonas sp.]|nr:cellulose biosynthesis cyclic di-GMP-binding regulatory protein BcsB [Methylomonas sp.]PPD22417.1 MAG: hypothetical protein CTY23_02370 [Methylomonas sp.]PPD37905.1 MAG: hypothetical protein CTY21_06020 [Methylomonas sp.]PPD42091.1 MAG: hypothetical protein CTY17_02165 [Methylomonas sp.]PPD53620.1 MAG: hypothetical protein CTY11_06035 [Methylomonas sp.]